MQQTPIELAISKLKKKRNDETLDPEYLRGLNDSIVVLNNLLPYEKQFLRDVAEKAWDECLLSCTFNTNGRDVSFDYDRYNQDKQTYLNQNHPL